jgi:hypothetical protein
MGASILASQISLGRSNDRLMESVTEENSHKKIKQVQEIISDPEQSGIHDRASGFLTSIAKKYKNEEAWAESVDYKGLTIFQNDSQINLDVNSNLQNLIQAIGEIELNKKASERDTIGHSEAYGFDQMPIFTNDTLMLKGSAPFSNDSSIVRVCSMTGTALGSYYEVSELKQSESFLSLGINGKGLCLEDQFLSEYWKERRAGLLDILKRHEHHH